MGINPLGIDVDVHVPAEGGYFVSERHARIAEIISEYDETLELAWIPPERREPGDSPFAVICRPLGRESYVVCYSDDPDERLLARVFGMDSSRQDVLSEVERQNAAVKALQMKKQMEEMEEARELTASIIRSPKSVYRHGGVTYR